MLRVVPACDSLAEPYPECFHVWLQTRPKGCGNIFNLILLATEFKGLNAAM